METLHEYFFDSFDKSMKEYDGVGAPFLKDGFVESILNRYPFLNDKRDFVITEHKRVRECDLYSRYSFLLYKMLVRNRGNQRITLAELPGGADLSARVDLEMAAYFSLLAFAPEMISHYEELGLPKEIITDTLADCFEGTVQLRNVTHDRDGFDDRTYFSWNQLYTNFNIIRIGVLNFELTAKMNASFSVFSNGKGEYRIMPMEYPVASGGMIAGSAGYPDEMFTATLTESDTEYRGYPVDTERARIGDSETVLKKAEWTRVLKQGDGVISVHIPTASRITEENCTLAYERCFETVKRYFPEFAERPIICQSWLLDPQIRDLLGEKSNIVSFGRQYLRYPIRSQGKAVFSFLFRKPFDVYENLPENTRLERAAKAHYLSGKFIYEVGGVIFPDTL